MIHTKNGSLAQLNSYCSFPLSSVMSSEKNLPLYKKSTVVVVTSWTPLNISPCTKDVGGLSGGLVEQGLRLAGFALDPENWPESSVLKFIYSEKATTFCEKFILLLSYVVSVKSKVKILKNFVAFSEYMNFNWSIRQLVVLNFFLYFFAILARTFFKHFFCRDM